MATQLAAAGALPDTAITVKVTVNETIRKFKLPIKDLNVVVFYGKMRDLLQVPTNQILTLERYSDSSGSFVPVDSRNPSSYKQLYRAAKAKLKLRLRASTKPMATSEQPAASPAQQSSHASRAVSEELPAESTPPREVKNERQDEPQTKHTEAPRLPSLSQILQEVADSRQAKADSTAQKAAAPAFGRHPLPTHLHKSLLEPPFAAPNWQVCCNKCDKQVTNEHYHCSICDGGDYDLCVACVQAGAVCGGAGHWMIKRNLKGGNFVNSTTETVPSKPKELPQQIPPMPGAFSAESKPVQPVPPSEVPERICNACIRHLPQKLVISCKDCHDYDLCMPCLVENKHGHHPGHTFVNGVAVGERTKSLCRPGRNTRHHAICDNCDSTILGVRHKCVDCPDFDFCSPCYNVKKSSHDHRFVPVYEPLAAPTTSKARHVGVYCDGPLCKGHRSQSYIQGVRYKCAVCNDTDFCANCEAHPSNTHNKTHPMIMFKTMVRDVSIQTVAQVDDRTTALGDTRAQRPLTRGPSVATLPRYSPPSAASEALPAYSMHASKSQPRPIAISELKAEFVRDTVPDGTSMVQNTSFMQTWTLKNPGPHVWPAGCSVRHIGGDYMLNLDQKGASSVAELARAQESNATAAPVFPGQSWHFTVQMKAPSRVGKHISYWRLKGPDGTPFGHKLWCDIQVQAVLAPAPPPSGSAADPKSCLHDFHMQLMLLEQQNKRRLMLARQEQEVSSQAPSAPAPVPPRSQATRESMLDNQYARIIAAASKIGEGIKQETQQEPAAGSSQQPDGTDSTMVFPKLEKESPASSTHEEIRRPASAADAVTSPSVATAATAETESITGEVTAKDEFESDSDDDGFLTDEEYDILDASDEEIINGTAS